MKTIEPLELKQILDEGGAVCLIDVREPEEHEQVRIEGSVLIPLGDLGRRLDEVRELCRLNYEQVVFYCRSGQRSAMAVSMVTGHGIANCANLRGGINAYATEADNSLTPY